MLYVSKKLDFFTVICLNSNIIDLNFCPLGYMRNDSGGVVVTFKNSLKLVKIKNNVISSDGFEIIYFYFIFNGLKIRFLSFYIPSNSSKYLIIVSNMINLFKHLISKKNSFTFFVTSNYQI